MGNKIKNKIIEKIKKENISMHSRYYFLARTSMWMLATVFVFATVVYLLSLIFFIFSGHALLGLAFFGPYGWMMLLRSLPWLLILAVIALIALLELLSSHFSFVYKRPLVYSLLAFIVVVIALGTLIARSTLHHRAASLSEGGKLPIAGPLYRGYALRQHKNVHIGTIESVKDDVLLIKTKDGKDITVHFTEATRRPPAFIFEEGKEVMVMGGLRGKTIEAFGIRPTKNYKNKLNRFRMK